MSKKDSLGDRMKSYEDVVDFKLPPRSPIILRIDGKAFHSYTRGLKRPWDDALTDVMDETAMTLCKNIQGAQVAYVQSDEISILIHGYKTFVSMPYFDGRLQKLCSVPASIAGATFTALSRRLFGNGEIKPAYFDCRAFFVPEADVCNYFLWRQQDATRNSIQSLARSLYSHKECNNKNTSQLNEMCFQKGQNWNDVPTRYKRGRCIIQSKQDKGGPMAEFLRKPFRSSWIVDNEIPIFSQDRDYINKLLATEDEA